MRRKKTSLQRREQRKRAEMCRMKKIKSISELDCNVPCAPTVPAQWVDAGGGFVMDLNETMIIPKQKQETENTMYNDERSEVQQQKDYLFKSLDQAMWQKRVSEQEAFNLNGPKFKTYGDLRAAIKNGWVSVSAEPSDTEALRDPVMYLLQVQDPTKLPDQAGYDAAMVQMAIDASAVKDQIVVMGAEKGLDALNGFKAKVYH